MLPRFFLSSFNCQHLVCYVLTVEPSLENVHIDTDTVLDTLAVTGFAALRDPGWKGKVDCFSYIEAGIEPTMVGCSSRDYKLTIALHKFVHLDTVLK